MKTKIYFYVMTLTFIFVAGISCTSPKLCNLREEGCTCKSDDDCDRGYCEKNRCVSTKSASDGGEAGSAGLDESGKGGKAATGGKGGSGAGGVGGKAGSGGSAGKAGTSGSGAAGKSGSSGSGGSAGKAGSDGGVSSSCNGSTTTDVCMAWCQLYCAYQPQYCTSSACSDTATFCSSNGAGTKSCLSVNMSLQELITACQELKTVSCGEFAGYCINSDPKCDGCKNTCEGGNLSTVGDGSCDDGGRGSVYSVCAYGTDCEDCGPRQLCNSSCETPSNGICEDGAQNSSSAKCDFGTDCNDCGSREIVCLDTCENKDDGYCEDGAPDADYVICDYGTDCSDCGPRPLSNCADLAGSCQTDSDCCGKGVTEFCFNQTCAAVCTQNSDCVSNCCYEFTTGKKVCAASTYCS
jgi:hypothetical protein